MLIILNSAKSHRAEGEAICQTDSLKGKIKDQQSLSFCSLGNINSNQAESTKGNKIQQCPMDQ